MVLNTRNFLISKNRNYMPTGKGALSRIVMPLAVTKKQMSKKMGISGSGGVLLLSEGLGSAEKNAVDGGMIRACGSGYGVKTPNKNLLAKLEAINIGKPKRKNVSLTF